MDEILDLEQAAELLHLNIRQVRDYASQGKIPHQRIGRHYRFSREVLIKHIQCPAEPTHYVRIDKGPSRKTASTNKYCLPGCLA